MPGCFIKSPGYNLRLAVWIMDYDLNILLRNFIVFLRYFSYTIIIIITRDVKSIIQIVLYGIICLV